MGEALERIYGSHLCYGPPIEEGFYYDMWTEGRYVFFISSGNRTSTGLQCSLEGFTISNPA